jgi:phosphomethylpyrimidine synthase
MNEHAKIKNAAPVSVTTGPIQGSHKVYAAPKGRPDLGVPFREVRLSDPKEAPVRVYDTSGPYTQSDFIPDLAKGLPALREPWIAARGYGAIEGRAIKPEDNGLVGEDRLAPLCPATRTLRAAAKGQLVTQYEFAKAGIVTEEMIYVAHRENCAREAALAGAAERHADGESFGAEIPEFVTPEFVRSEVARGRPTSTMSNWSRWRSAVISLSRSTPISAIRRCRQASRRRSRSWCGRSAGAPTR